MTGLDKILNEIQKESDDNTALIIRDAQSEAEEILSLAKTDTASAIKSIEDKTTALEADILSRSKSAGELSVRKAILLKKRQIINQIIEEAYGRLLALPDDEYFAFLIKALNKFAHDESGEILLNKRDKGRISSAFKKAFEEKKLLLSTKDIKSEGGFILIYGNIEENCTFEAIIEAKREHLTDLVMQTVFNQEVENV